MEIIKELQSRLNYSNPVVTIGNFDGVHKGHQKIFSRVVEKAHELNGTSVAITFHPHPVRVLYPDRGLKILTTFEDKIRLIASTGIKVVICINFTREFSRMDPEDFIKDILIGKIDAKWVIVGHNYAFGKGKKGTTALLRRRGRKYGFGVTVVRYAKVYDDIVNSSRIRSLLFRGRVCEASRMLGRPYHIEGMVIKGAGRGASLLNIPTANITTLNELVPREGVYAVKVLIKDSHEYKDSNESIVTSNEHKDKNNSSLSKLVTNNSSLVTRHSSLVTAVYDGVANIGKNPTFNTAVATTFATTSENIPMSYEVHIFDFNRNLLGQEIRIHFIDRIRDEKKFGSIGELEESIKKDIEKAKEILSKRSNHMLLYF
jgi:riboflavin kinase/FMN adenylyltransferase